MSIRDALNAVPAKPIMAVAVVFTFLAAGWHGWNLKSVCSYRATLTESLHQWANVALGDATSKFQLADAVTFDWDDVRIAHPTKIPAKSQNCPFGWHWNNEKRAELAKAGNLTFIGFSKNGRLIEIVDFDRQIAQFDVTSETIPRVKAVFRASGRHRLQISTP